MRVRHDRPIICDNCGSEYDLSRLVWFLATVVIWFIVPIIFLATLYVIANFYIALAVWFLATCMIHIAVFYFAPIKLVNKVMDAR